MLKLQTKTFVLPVNIKPEILEVFEHPIIFYLSHKDDKRKILPTFTVLDFKKSELQYTVSYLPDNIRKVEDYADQEVLVSSPDHNPHCSLKIKDGQFLTLVDQARYFYLVDSTHNKMHLYTTNDLQVMTGKNIQYTCSTAYKDDEDPNYFYLSTATSSKSLGDKELLFYRVRLDLSEFQLLNCIPRSNGRAPHVTRKIGNCLLNSEFVVMDLKNTETGNIFEGSDAYFRFIYKDLYRSFCALHNKNIDESIAENIAAIALNNEFQEYIQTKGRNFFEICENDKKYAFSVGKGTITLVDIQRNAVDSYNTTNCMPGHFEIDESTNTVYISSHNFVMLPKHGYLGPAAIEEFLFIDGKLEKKGTFSHPDGYRFTTHKFFQYKDKRYLCTFGHPNRLFFINADTMEMEYSDDIEQDVLSEQPDIRDFLNYTKLETLAIRAIEVSSDGQYLFLLSHHFIYFYSFPERKIIQKIKYANTIPLGDSLNLEDFRKNTSHSNYLL